MSAGAYVLVKFNDREKLIPAIESLNDASAITRWNAIDGEYNLVLKLSGSKETVIDRVRKLDGFSALLSCDIEADNEPDDSLAEVDFAYSYVFIEAEAEKKQAVETALSKLDAVAFCSPASGDADFVALVKGQTFDAIDRVVNDRMRVIDGVVRLKQDRVIHLDRV